MLDSSEWDSSREWSERWVRWLLRTVADDWRNERVSRDFFDKLHDRRITRQHVRTTLTSQSSYIGHYWYDSHRVGFWDPRSRLFVVWKPNSLHSPSRLMTAFVYHGDGIAYMQRFTPFREIRGPQQ